MADKITIREWIANFVSGEYDAADVNTQIDAGWFDWFCKDSSLQKRTEKLGKKIIQICKSNKIDIDNSYVFFKNNCPMSGGTYDSFSICSMDKGDVLFWVAKPSYSKNWEVFSPVNEFNEALVEGSWTDVKKWFLAA